MIIRGHEKVLRAEAHCDDCMDLHWDVIITSAAEATFCPLFSLDHIQWGVNFSASAGRVFARLHGPNL